jgi:hypothetical protein
LYGPKKNLCFISINKKRLLPFLGVILLVWLTYFLGKYIPNSSILVTGISLAIGMIFLYQVNYVRKLPAVLTTMIIILVFFLSWAVPELDFSPCLTGINQSNSNINLYIYNTKLGISKDYFLSSAERKRINLPLASRVIDIEKLEFLFVGTGEQNEVLFVEKIIVGRDSLHSNSPHMTTIKINEPIFFNTSNVDLYGDVVINNSTASAEQR